MIHNNVNFHKIWEYDIKVIEEYYEPNTLNMFTFSWK